MPEHLCKNCELGLKFATLDELKNHQAKFCSGSNYSDVAHLDAKLASLKRPNPNHAKGSLGDIQDYLNGKSDLSQALPINGQDDLNYYSAISPDRKRPNDGIVSGEYSSVPRTEGDLLDMLGNMQKKKEDELKQQIEKEEISRLFQNVERRQLGNVGKSKEAELDQIMRSGQDVLDREKALADEVKRMEANLVSKESAFAGINDNSTAAYDDQQRSINQREIERRTDDLANARAAQVAQVKAERERLEQERQRIMQQLGNNSFEGGARTGSGAGPRDGSRGGFRKNASAQRLGSALTNQSDYNSQPALGGDIKGRLIADQSRLNNLRQDQQNFARNNPANEFGDIDVLQRELGKHSNYYDQVQRLTDEYGDKNVPKKDEMLGDIRRALEHESAAPRSVPQKRHNDKLQEFVSPGNILSQNGAQADNNLLAKLDDLESLLVQSGANTQQPAKRRPPRPTALPPQAPVAAPQPAFYPQPVYAQPQDPYVYGAGVPQQPVIYQQDPAMAQFATLLKQQETENKQLKDVLEKFGKETAPIEQLDGTIDGATRQLLSLKNDPMAGPLSAAAGFGAPSMIESAVGPVPGGGLPFPDEFAFKQNETRVADLEREERALMNLQAQEYDQLRMLQRLDKNSDLYEYKLKQFKELSAMRAEAEKVLQEQRIEKLKRDFDREKADEDREAHHQLWLENQKRLVLEARVSGAPQPQYPMPQAQMQQPPQPTQAPPIIRPKPMRQQTLQQQEPPVIPAAQEQQRASPERNLMTSLVQFDSIFNLPRAVPQLKLIAATYQGERPVGKGQQVGPADVIPDQQTKGFGKCQLNQRRVFPDVPAEIDSRVLIEVQMYDPQPGQEFIGVGWTWINLNDRASGRPRSGPWTLPIYTGAVSPGIANGTGQRPAFAPGLALTVSLGKPGDQIAPSSTVLDLDMAPVPKEHAAGTQQLATKRPSVASGEQSPALQKQPTLARQKTISQARRGPDPTYQVRGMNLIFHYVQNLVAYHKLTLRVSLHHGGDGQFVITQDNGQPCQIQVDPVADSNQMRVSSGNAVMLNKANNKLSVVEEFEIGEIRQNEYSSPSRLDSVVRPLEGQSFTWLRDLHQLYWQKDGTEPIVLLVEVHGKTAPDAKRTLLAFSVSDVVDRQTGKLITGFVESPLYAPPLTFTPVAQKQAVGQNLAFSIYDPDNLPVFENRSRQATPSQRPESGAYSAQFIANFDKQLTLADGWLESEALDIYIDAARHLPDNCTVVKCTARIVDAELNDQGPKQVMMPRIEESSLRNQVYRYKYELRFPGVTRGSSILYLKFETIDKSKNQARNLGSAYFPLFLRAEDGMPAGTNDGQGIVAHIGNYQMPIYAGLPNIQVPFTYERFVYMERVPTASVLLRIMKAPKDQFAKPIDSEKLPPEEVDKYFVNAPAYKEGVYSTQYFPLTDDERAIMNLRRRRRNPPLGAVADSLIAAQGQGSDLIGEARNQFLDKVVNAKNQQPLVDLNFFSQYEPGLGFRVNVEAVHDNQLKAFLGVLASVIPPGSYYDQVRDDGPLQDGFMFSELDYNSKYVTQKFNEGDAIVLGFPATKPGLAVLFDIKAYLPNQKQYVSYGFALLPLLDIMETDLDTNTIEYFVATGVFSLPVYQGNPSPALVAELRASTDPAGLLAQKVREKKLQLLDSTSIIVRCIDGQRKNNFIPGFEKRAPSTRYLTQSQRSTHIYKKIEDSFFTTYEPLADLMPRSYLKNPQEFTKILAQSFADSLKIPA